MVGSTRSTDLNKIIVDSFPRCEAGEFCRAAQEKRHITTELQITDEEFVKNSQKTHE